MWRDRMQMLVRVFGSVQRTKIQKDSGPGRMVKRFTMSSGDEINQIIRTKGSTVVSCHYLLITK
ncbi:hypothetical protein CHS0354_021192 [Potamilus streckersoni]|uniref:Uncharacterized protein n=1 Tax=Potamilus streckersoni TaxID=2493646 RepID=A0AAE0W0X9_9BIVA|nr:hypothetical protein CHS0354_021192 [Potamilus streckersoni]